jgi:3-methyladenine DNA glycosylase AlkD
LALAVCKYGWSFFLLGGRKGKGMDSIYRWMIENVEESYVDFQRKILPDLEPERILGVKTAVLRSKAKEMIKEGTADAFLAECPHTYFEEMQLHAFILAETKDFDECMKKVEEFLPYIDNWATCDQMSPKVFKKKKKELLPYIQKWLKSDHLYTKRFAIVMLMQHYLEDAFHPEYLDWVASIHSDEYYLNTAIAWYMSMALAKQWDAAVGYIEHNKMDVRPHNLTIQKAYESLRLTRDEKNYLKKFKR